MNWEIDDPRWTAFLLDECSAAEAKEAEAQLQADPGLRSEVDELKIILTDLQEELSEEETPVFDPLRREAVLQSQKPKVHTRIWLPTAIAALFAVSIGISHYLTLAKTSSPDSQQEEETVMDTANEPLPPSSPPAERLSRGVMSPMTAPAPVMKKSQSTERQRLKEDKSEEQPETRGIQFTGGHIMEMDNKENRDAGFSDRVAAELEVVPTPTPTPTPTPEPETGPGAPPPPQLP